MPNSIGPSRSLSSDLFEPEDPEFIELLQTIVLPGDIETPTELAQPDVEGHQNEEDINPFLSKSSLKRKHSETDELPSPNISQSPDGLTSEQNSTKEQADIYGASRFGRFDEYMQRKRAKLQIQNASMDINDKDGDKAPHIFKGLAIYINGWTEPSVQDLRRLIVKHGGVFHPYLDKKSLVTHIITCSLTPAKIRDFKNMKVVRPEWLVESAERGILLPWRNYIFKPGERLQESQGTRSTQQSLFSMSEVRDHAVINDTSDRLTQGKSTNPSNIVAATSSHSRPLYVTDPATREDAARVPGYAAQTSNAMAERVMANPEWRAAHTSIAPDFIEGFYRNSRLHHLSTWKAELKNLVMEAQSRAESDDVESETSDANALQKSGSQDELVLQFEDGVSMTGVELTMKHSPKGKGNEKAGHVERVLMHCDFDCFFVSAGLVSRPHLRGKPVVVCHSQGSQGGASSTSEIASSSYEARAFGIKNGMSLQQVRQLCPAVVTIPYEFENYRQFSIQFYTILMRHADDLQAVSVDEALMDVTSSVSRIRRGLSAADANKDPTIELAEKIRDEVRQATQCEVSIGIAHNIMLARLATRRAKPAGSFHLVPEKAREFLAPLDIDDLHGFGHSTYQKAQEKLGVTTLGELAKKSKVVLCDALGKGNGETLYKAIRGIDERKLESDKPRKSVSCDINYGIRFENNDQAEKFIYQMAQEVSRRLDNVDMLGRSLTLKIMKRDASAPIEAPKFLGHGICETFNKQIAISGSNGRATSDSSILGDFAWKLLKSFDFDPKELRGIGIQVQKLEPSTGSTEPGQAKLPFKPVAESPTKARARTPHTAATVTSVPSIVIEASSQENNRSGASSTSTPIVDLPSFSQVDKEVFDALPEDVRKELENEYLRRLHSPMLQTSAAPKSKSSEPVADHQEAARKGTNVKRITQQLAPKSGALVSPRKQHMLFAKRGGPSAVHVSEAELEKLDIDPGVFFMLPVDMQREQLLIARHSRAGAGVVTNEQKGSKAPRAPSTPHRRPPLPKAVYPNVPFLKQQGKQKGEKLYFTETEDVQRVIEAWVEGFKEHPPNQRDVDYFSKFIVQSTESADSGMEKAIAILKWWLILLRRNWEVWEHDEDDVRSKGNTSEAIGKMWWKYFRDVKGRVDAVARKRFGGSISIK